MEVKRAQAGFFFVFLFFFGFLREWVESMKKNKKVTRQKVTRKRSNTPESLIAILRSMFPFRAVDFFLVFRFFVFFVSVFKRVGREYENKKIKA